MDQIVSHGKVVRGYLGLLPQDVSPTLAKQFGVNQPGGALVGQVEPDTPAAKAGLKRGDVILTLNGQAVDSANDLRLRISQTAPGTTVKLGVSRDGKMQDFNVTLGELPEKVAQEGGGKENGPGGLQGVEVQNLTPDIAQQLQLARRHQRCRGYVGRPVQPGGVRAGSRGCHPGSQPQASSKRRRI